MPSRLQIIERYRRPDRFADACDVSVRGFEKYFKDPTALFIADYAYSTGFLCHGGKLPSDLLECENCPFSSEGELRTVYENLGWEYHEPTR